MKFDTEEAGMFLFTVAVDVVFWAVVESVLPIGNNLLDIKI